MIKPHISAGPGLRSPQLVSLRYLLSSVVVILTVLGAGFRARGATVPILTNFANVLNPVIDANSLVNFNTINASNSSLVFNQNLFSTFNTLYYTNTLSGLLSADLGFQLDYVANNQRQFANYIVNDGTIRGDTLLLSATNVYSSGFLEAGTLLQLQGQYVSLSRGIVSATFGTGSNASSGFRFVDTNGLVYYQDPSFAADLYWGAGTNNVMTASAAAGASLFLPSLDSVNNGFRPPRVSSPAFEVESLTTSLLIYSRTRSFTSLTGTNYQSYVRLDRQGTNATVQVVLVQTNQAATNLSADVRWSSFGGFNFSSLNSPMVQFSAVGTDPATGVPYTNYLYFFDYTGTETNSVLSSYYLQQNATARPAAYDFSRYSYSWPFGQSSNSTIGAIRFSQPGIFQFDTITNNFYSAWQVALGNASFGPAVAGYDPVQDDPTNSLGRVEITANDLDLSSARIQADGLVSVTSPNLLSSVGTKINAPFISLNIANTNTTLTLTNFAPAGVAQPNGYLSFYSTTWTNVDTNATPNVTYKFSVLMVDASKLDGITPVTLQQFNVKGTNVIINSGLSIGNRLQVDSPAVTFSPLSTLSLPIIGATNLTSTNFPNVKYFTNFGAISVPYDCTLGSDRSTPIDVFVNGGSVLANNITIRATDYQNMGTNRTVAQTSSGGGGPISILADSAKFDGGSGRGWVAADGAILLAANELKMRNHQVTTLGSLVLNVTNLLTDVGQAGTNRFDVGLGFTLVTKPAAGDLLGTTIASSAPANRSIPHQWAAEDRGPFPAGYNNNAAVGRLLLDTSINNSQNRLTFSGVGASNALYVDYLELNGTLTNDLASHLFVDTNMVVYFANANVPVETLDGQLGGRLRWVKDFAGPNTSVDYRLPDGRTIRVNVAKLNSLLLDSDADGVANQNDLSPFDGVVIRSQVTFTNVPPLTAFITWEAAAQTIYQVEVNTNLLTDTWRYLSSYTNLSTTNRVVTFSDVVPVGASERYYRVGYQP